MLTGVTEKVCPTLPAVMFWRKAMSLAQFLGKIIVGSHVQEVIHNTEPWTDGRTWVLSRIWTPISGGALCLAFSTGFSASLPAHSTGRFDSRSLTPALAPLCLEPWKLTVNSGYCRGDLALRIWGLQHLAFERAKLGILFAPWSPMIDATSGCLVLPSVVLQNRSTKTVPDKLIS